MIILVRVDDRLLHGQIICAWVPFIKADSLVVASDEAAGDSLVSEIIESCGCKGLSVHVKKVTDAIDYITKNGSGAERVILIVGDLRDALRIYQEGFRFNSLNLGNIHHEDNGRKITPSVIINSEDEKIIKKLEESGVAIDIRDVPASSSVPYVHERGKGC